MSQSFLIERRLQPSWFPGANINCLLFLAEFPTY